jgi:hypothetical protein
MNLPVLLRHSGELVAPLIAAGLLLAVLGPNLRGAAGAALAAAALLAARLRSRGAVAGAAPPLHVLQRVHLGPRLTLALVEASGRRYLVTSGGAVTALPLEEPP